MQLCCMIGDWCRVAVKRGVPRRGTSSTARIPRLAMNGGCDFFTCRNHAVLAWRGSGPPIRKRATVEGAEMTSEAITWQCDGQTSSLGLDRSGNGPTVLLLPALSSISTRREMQPLQERLAGSFSTVSIDWPGFGELPKPFVDWRRDIYDAYLTHLVRQVVPNPFAIVAAGHAAGYVLRHFAAHGQAAERLVLLSPTWRGPLPTMVGGDRALFPKIAKAVDRPLLGPILYALNVNRPLVGMMARGHVYADSAWIEGDRMAAKLAVTRTLGARHGSARFVTGCLDPFASRDELLTAARRVAVPMLNLFAKNAPLKSRMEMEALAILSNVTTMRVTQGKLSFYEEFADETAELIGPFLAALP
jgi:pimeloyl-ACP methyl ester carboxylesterase